MLEKLAVNRIDYFMSPVQIQFYHNQEWQLGIGYRGEIINCETGEVIKTAQVLLENPLEDYPIEICDGWVNLYR